METSAKESINVQTAFDRVLSEIYKIATKNAVKEPGKSSPTVKKGASLSTGEDEVKEKDKKIQLSNKKAKSGGKKKGCC